MNPQISYLAKAFYVLAAVLGLPAILGMLFSIVFGIRLWLTPTPTTSTPTKNPDAIILMLEGMARVFGTGASVIGAVGKVLVELVAVVSTVTLIAAVVFFFTGRGLAAGQPWARGMATAVLGCLLLVSLLATVSMRMPVRLLPAVFVGAAVYALWLLWRSHAA